MDKLDEFARRGQLFDFYGALLTEHQQRIYREVVLEDYSISEVAEDEGISRQGVHDLIKRCDSALEEYDEKLELIDKFEKIKSIVKGSSIEDDILEIL